MTILESGVSAPTPGTRPPAAPPSAAGGRPRVHREHGTPDRYRNGPDEHDQPGKGCRCTPCRAAQATYMRDYRMRKAREAWGAAQPPMVDAEPARAHVRTLMAHGIGWERIADIAGVASGSVSGLIYGRPAAGDPPSAKLRRATAEKLFAVTADDIAEHTSVDATGTRRRLQALVAVGWSGSELMRQLGKTPTNFWYIIDATHVRRATARAVQELYDRLWDQPPPTDTSRQRAAAARSRNRAQASGWAPPQAWDDDVIDDPDAEPNLGEKVSRAVALLEDSEELLGQGFSLAQIAERFGVTRKYLENLRREAAAQPAKAASQ